LDVLKTLCFEARLDLELILKQDFVCWRNLVLILKQCLTFEATLFDSFLASSKSCIHTFTFSPFLMMTIIIKWFLFSIIKTSMIHKIPMIDVSEKKYSYRKTSVNVSEKQLMSMSVVKTLVTCSCDCWTRMSCEQ